MKILVSSIHASGNKFTMDLIPFRWQSAYTKPAPFTKREFHFTEPNRDLLDVLMDECTVIVPLRSKEETRKSWERRGIKHFDFWWREINSLRGVFFFRIGSDDSLADLSRLIGIHLRTDWRPANQLVI